jgi:hypothetical protein
MGLLTKRNLIHSNHMVTTINATSVQITYFYNYSWIIPTIILIINVCSHICNYRVDIIE